MTADTQSLDPERDQDQIKVIERFSEEYFNLVVANTTAENALLSSQQEGEELLVNLPRPDLSHQVRCKGVGN